MTWGPLRAALPSGLVALDFDGTLAPISPRPADARPLAGVGQILRDVRATGATLAVITGRSVASLLHVSGFGAIPGIVVYGTHGAERWQAGALRTAEAPPGLDELRLSLPRLLLSGLALSLDNLVIGFALGTYQTGILLSALVIGSVSVAMSLAGLEIGARVGQWTRQRQGPRGDKLGDRVGGALLILVGIAVAAGVFT